MARLVASRRILVLGSSGSGKTTLSIRLAEAIETTSHSFRRLLLAAGLEEYSASRMEESKSPSFVQRESWIMDGTYESTLDVRIPVADCIIVIDQSRLVCLWRVLKRKWSVDDHRRPDAPAGQKAGPRFPAIHLAVSHGHAIEGRRRYSASRGR